MYKLIYTGIFDNKNLKFSILYVCEGKIVAVFKIKLKSKIKVV